MNCLVCLKAAVESDEIVATSCGHCYHKHCIGKWLEKSSFCPSCCQPATPSSLLKLFIEFSDGNNLPDIDDLNEQIFLREKEISELKLSFKNSELQVKTLKRKLIKNTSTMETLKHELQEGRNLSSISQAKLKEIQLKFQAKVDANTNPQNDFYHHPSQLSNPYQHSNAYQSINVQQTNNGYQCTNQHQPANYRCISSHNSSNICQFPNGYEHPSFRSFAPLDYPQPSNAHQTSISFQPPKVHETPKALIPSSSSNSQCYRCNGKGYIECASDLPSSHTLFPIFQHCFMCMGKGYM